MLRWPHSTLYRIASMATGTTPSTRAADESDLFTYCLTTPKETGHAEHHDPVVRRAHRPAEARDHRRDHRGHGEDRLDDSGPGPHRVPGRREGELGRQRQARERLGDADGLAPSSLSTRSRSTRSSLRA